MGRPPSVRGFDWVEAPLVLPRGLPASLRTTVSTLLHSSPPPMVPVLGPELSSFYNDASPAEPRDR